MIKKILKLNEIGKFSSIVQEKDFQFGNKNQNCNIIFGFNGSGKTTISNSLSFFADTNFISEEEKLEIFNDIKNNNNSNVELTLQGNSTIKYPANSAHSKNIYVFNSNFVSTHVFDGTKGNIKKFSNVGGEIKNKHIDNINKQLIDLDKEKDELEDENKKLDEKNDDITKNRSASFGKILTDKNKKIQSQDLNRALLPSESIEILETRISSLSTDYDLSKKQVELNTDLEEIRKINFDLIELNLEETDKILSKNIQQLSKEVLDKKINDVQELFLDQQYKQSVEKWFRFGKSVLENINTKDIKCCPICDTDISEKINSVLLDYQGYFDYTYEAFVKELKQKIDDVSNIIATVNQYELNTEVLEKIKVKYFKFLTDYIFEKYNFTNIKDDLKKLEDDLKLKNNNIQNIFTKIQNIETNLILLNSSLAKFKKFKDDILKFLETKKLDTNKIEEQLRKTYKEIILLEFNSIHKSGAIQKYINNTNKIVSIKNNEIPLLKNKLSDELKKIKAESKSISKYLIKMGITHFDININENNKDENIIIKYQSSTIEKNTIKNCLSEGEKTALAFAYFLSKFENEINTVEKIKNSVVVIDDPISSLDDNRLYSTANLIREKFEDVKQLIILSHNFLFLKYFNSFHAGKIFCFFLDKDKLSDLPEELNNFETPYFFMLKNLIDFLDDTNKDVTYNEVKKHLPNFIRRILETFLSFKFAKIAGKRQNQSPGLIEFNDSIEETNFDDSIKTELKNKIIEINRICDSHSHGNAHHTQENFYISETELKILSHNAIYIIETMDNLHKTCFTKNEQEQIII
ncbi:MAG: AAA family ATPase [Candidatus Gracilibacteria bacterium]|nr:AAA family ATPase [Candidatus Gracilibacteria bacterium]